MTEQTREQLFPSFKIPDDPDEALRVLEDAFIGNVDSLEQNPPDPLAPLGLQTAHRIATGRARSDAEVIRELHEQQDKR